MSKKKLELTPASSWGSVGALVEMPSGKVAKLKRISPLAMLRDDSVPNFLKTYLYKKILGDQTPDNALDEVDNPQDVLDLMLYIASETFEYPKLVDGVPQADDEVCIDNVPMEDLMHAMGYGFGDQKVVRQLENFRKTAKANVESVPASDAVGQTAEPVAGD